MQTCIFEYNHYTEHVHILIFISYIYIYEYVILRRAGIVTDYDNELPVETDEKNIFSHAR